MDNMIIDRKVKPQPNGKVNFKLPEIQIFTLDNGLKVYYVHKNTLPITQVNLIIHSGSRYDFSDESGLAQLTSMLIDEGAGNLTGLEIDNEIELLGSILSIDSAKEYSSISLLSLNENIHRSLELFTLILQEPNFNEVDFKREKEKLITHILQQNDNPAYIANTEFKSYLFNNTPYKFPNTGLTKTVEKITNNSVQKFYQENYLPSNTSLIIVSGSDEHEIYSLAQRYFGNWKTSKKVESLKVNFKNSEKKIILIDKPDASQSELKIGHLSKSRKSKDFYAASVMNSILGGQFSSRINLNLREDKGYTYGAHSSFSYNSFGGYFSVSSSVKTENTGDAIKEILFELENIKSTVTQKEVEFAKSYLIRRYPALFETYSQLASNLSLIPIFDLDKDYFDNYTDNISKVTIEDVSKAANDNILLDNLTIVIVGDKTKVLKQLNDFSSFCIIEKSVE
jgi:zinc protease